jgi:hypothetical protein
VFRNALDNILLTTYCVQSLQVYLILVTGSSIYILVSNKKDGPTVPGVLVINLFFVPFQVAAPMFIDMSWITILIFVLIEYPHIQYISLLTS